jgi:hypothetical protein
VLLQVTRATIATRRARIARVNRKRSSISVEVKREPSPAARERLLDVLFELLEPIVNSGRK